MVMIVFRSRLRADADLPALEPVGARMYELASSMPGFISYKDFQAEDKEGLTLVEFDSAEHLRAWREHPEHVAAQEFGREKVFESYEITVCNPIRRYSFSKDKGRVESA
jgi:heme-degrading monooxygenase HmoA